MGARLHGEGETTGREAGLGHAGGKAMQEQLPRAIE